jgi:AcrR family transcriptional regulator
VDVDEAGRHDRPLGVDHPVRTAGDVPHLDDHTVIDRDVGTPAGRTRTVHDRATAHHEIDRHGLHSPVDTLECRGWHARVSNVSVGTEATVHDVKRRAVIETVELAACELLLRDGLDVTMDDIADVSGVSRRTLFRHFESRERLLASAFERGIRHYGEQLPEMTGDWRDALAALCDATHRMQASYGPGYWDLLHRRDLPPELEAVEARRRVRRRRAMDHLAAQLFRLAGGTGPTPASLKTAFAGFSSARFTAAIVHDAQGSWKQASRLAYDGIAAELRRVCPDSA